MKPAQNSLFALVVLSLASSSSSSTLAADGWRPTRSDRQSLFPADEPGKIVETRESPALFPADHPGPLAGRVRPRTPKGKPTTVRKSAARSSSGRPVFPVRAAFQPPPAPPYDSKVPPAPAGGESRGPMKAKPDVTWPAEGGFSEPMETAGPELTDVGEVFADEGCGACDACGCDDDWCHRHCWCRSTCDMPLHFPYYPEKHGYYYFLPYNYRHIEMHSQLAPILGGDPQAPYETGMFPMFYAEVPDIDKHVADERLPEIDDGEKLPNLEETLKRAAEQKKKPAESPPEPKLKAEPKK